MKNDIYVERNVVFAENEKEVLTADIFRPSQGENIPIILLIHGGAFQSGSKEMYAEWGPMLAEEGFLAMAINYRLSTSESASWPGVMEDVNCAVNWLIGKANEWNLEPMKMGVLGDSAGAYLGTYFTFESMAKSSFKILACASVYGIYDLTEPQSEREAQLFQRFLGHSREEQPDLYKKASISRFIETASLSPTFDTKFLLMWGEDDLVASPMHSINFATKLINSNIECEQKAYKDCGHFWLNRIPGLIGGGLNDYPNREAVPEIVTFFREKLLEAEVVHFSEQQIKRLVTM